MDRKKVLTYSFLAHIHNTGTLISDLLDIFVPLAKKTLSSMNNEGIYSGKSISEIKSRFDALYGLDIPLPVLRKILQKIAQQINTEFDNKFIIYGDNAFAIKNYLFTDFDAFIEKRQKEIVEIESLFRQFCEINNIKVNTYSSIFDFIEINKLTIGGYLSHNKPTNTQQDFTAEAKFIDFFRQGPVVYELVKSIYLGSIISTYIEFKTEVVKSNIELIFDTNFILGLLDLHTPESTHTCNKLIEVGKSQGFQLNILQNTIDEICNLLKKKAEHFDRAFLVKRINPEDIYNACDRRNLKKTDLERIADNIEEVISNKSITIVSHIKKYENIAKFSPEYERLKKIRTNATSALHDATTIHYVKDKRGGKPIKNFEDVNCWIVNNSISTNRNIFFQGHSGNSNGYQAESIKVDDLLNILWLSNPGLNYSIRDNELADIGITTLITCTLNEMLPKSSIIRELDDNIQKYAKDKLSDKDIIRVATRITNKNLRNIEELNNLAEKNAEEFVRRLENESNIQKEKDEGVARKLEELFESMRRKKDELDQETVRLEKERDKVGLLNGDLQKKDDIIVKERKKRLYEENIRRKEKREIYVGKEILKWRTRSWIELAVFLGLVISGIVYIFYNSEWSFKKISVNISNLQVKVLGALLSTVLTSIFSGVIINTLILRYRNHSNIKAYKESLVIPENLTDLKELMD